MPTCPLIGRGLLIVRALSTRSGITATGPLDNPTRRTIWYDIKPR